jgi:hypothetical protein
MLVVVHHGNVEGLLEALFDVEAFRSLDILEVDTTESGGYALNSLAELLRVFLCNLDIEHVDTAIDLKEQTFTLHNGLTAHGTDITKAKYGCAVRDNGNEVTLIGILIRCIRIFLNLKTGLSNNGRVGGT